MRRWRDTCCGLLALLLAGQVGFVLPWIEVCHAVRHAVSHADPLATPHVVRTRPGPRLLEVTTLQKPCDLDGPCRNPRHHHPDRRDGSARHATLPCSTCLRAGTHFTPAGAAVRLVALETSRPLMPLAPVAPARRCAMTRPPSRAPPQPASLVLRPA